MRRGAGGLATRELANAMLMFDAIMRLMILQMMMSDLRPFLDLLLSSKQFQRFLVLLRSETIRYAS